jgi:hypothetical protein
MVDYSGMFRADPRIKRRRRFADTLQAQALRPIQAPANPYGFNPLAEALQRVTAAFGGSMASSAADQREAEQRAARTQVMAHLLKAGSARTGQLTQTQVPLPGPDYARTRTQYSVADDGSQRAIEPLPAGVFEKAGGIAGGYQIALADARARRDTLTQARLERDIKNRLGEVGAKLANDRNNPELFAEVQQLRSLLDPAGFATEAATEQMVRGAEKRKDARTQEAEIRVVNQQIERRKRELGYKLDAEGRKALAWTVQQDYSRANRNIDEIEREKRAVTRAIAEEKRRLGRDLSQEERSNLEYIARQELHLGVTIDAERRAELIIVNRENRARTRLIATEKRAVDRAIQVREADLRRTLTAEERAETTYKARAEFDGQRDEIKALAAAKRKRIPVWYRDSGDKDFITQEMMDADQAGKSPEYTYDAPDTGWPKAVKLRTPVNGQNTTFVTKEQMRVDLQLPENQRRYAPVPGMTLDNEGNFSIVKDPQDVAELKSGQVATEFAIANIRSLLEKINESGGLVGIPGALARGAAGAVGMFYEPAGEFIAEQVVGLSAEELQAFKTQVKFVTAPLIPVITGEESGRYTHAEREETKNAVAALDIAKSAPQVRGALKTILGNFATRQAKVAFVLGKPFDVTSREGILAQTRKLKEYGLEIPEVEEIVKMIQRAYKGLKALDPEYYRAVTGREKLN